MFAWLWYIRLWIKEALVGFFRNFGWNMAALVLSIVCMAAFAVSFIAGESAKSLASKIGDKIEIQIDLLDSVKTADYPTIEERLKAIGDVKQVTFVSKEDAYKKMEKELGDNADVLHALDANPFPAIYLVKLKDPQNVQLVAKQIGQWGVSQNIQYGKGYVEKMLAAIQNISKIGYFVSVAVALLSVYIVGSVIKLNIDQRKDEIRIKQLTGSGMFTIRFPFVLEALMITALSCGAVYLALYFGYDRAVAQMKQYVSFLPMVATANVLTSISAWLVGLAAVIGLLGSSLAARRYVQKS